MFGFCLDLHAKTEPNAHSIACDSFLPGYDSLSAMRCDVPEHRFIAKTEDRGTLIFVAKEKCWFCAIDVDKKIKEKFIGDCESGSSCV